MGILKFDCMTTNPAATIFYGVTNADSYGGYTAGGWNKNMVLVKSNANPSSITNTNWAFVSSYSSKSLSIASGIPTVAGCAVDSRGVVTFVAAHYVYDATKPYSEYITALRYDPAGVADPALSQGTGSWSTLTLNPAFGQMLIGKLSLWYTTVIGVETLNIALTDIPTPSGNDSVHFGTFDATTMTFNPTGKWVMVKYQSSSLLAAPEKIMFLIIISSLVRGHRWCKRGVCSPHPLILTRPVTYRHISNPSFCFPPRIGIVPRTVFRWRLSTAAMSCITSIM